MKFLIFFLLSLSLTASAQQYKFDYMLKSENIREDSKYNSTSFDMINSKDHNYYMEVGQNSITGKYYSILFDYDKKEFYRFDINNRKIISPSPLLFAFKSITSPIDVQFIYYNDLQIEKIGKYRYKIIGNKSTKRKKKNKLEITLELEPHTHDLLIFDFEPLTTKQQQEILVLLKNTLKSENGPGHFFIKEITFHYFKDSLFKKKITPVKIDVNLNIE